MGRVVTRKIEPELTFRAAAERLGRTSDPDGRKLRAMVLAREKATGKRIAVRLAGPKRPRLRVALGALYRAFPELRSARVDDLAELIRPMVERMDARQDERTKKVVYGILERDLELRLRKLEKHAASNARTQKG
jgi:hypothetical protein